MAPPPGPDPSSDPDPSSVDHPDTAGAVRPARPGDLPALLAVQSGLDRGNPALLRSLLAGAGAVLVSPGPRGPAGYLAAIPCGDLAHVAELAVAPDHRREGRATDLLRAARAGTDADRIRLAVAPDNDPALACYRSVGFRVVERDPDYFEGDPAVIMERPAEEATG